MLDASSRKHSAPRSTAFGSCPTPQPNVLAGRPGTIALGMRLGLGRAMFIRTFLLATGIDPGRGRATHPSGSTGVGTRCGCCAVGGVSAGIATPMANRSRGSGGLHPACGVEEVRLTTAGHPTLLE